MDVPNLMASERADFTNTFRALSTDTAHDHFMDQDTFRDWHVRWSERRDRSATDAMEQTNPAVIPRNHRIEQAISAAVAGDFAPFERLNAVLASPFTLSEENRDLARPPTETEEVRETFCGT